MISQKEKEIGSGGRRSTFSRLFPFFPIGFARRVAWWGEKRAEDDGLAAGEPR